MHERGEDEALLTEILVLNIPPWFPVKLGHVMALLGEVLDEQLLGIVSAPKRREVELDLDACRRAISRWPG